MNRSHTTLVFAFRQNGVRSVAVDMRMCEPSVETAGKRMNSSDPPVAVICPPESSGGSLANEGS